MYSKGQKHAVDAACRFVAAAGSRLGAVTTDDVVVYWYSFSNHYTKRAFTQP